MENPERFLGTNIGKYRLAEFIGKGGMANVYKAFHPDLKRYAAIKILNPDTLSDEKFLEHFRNEAQNMALLRHPNIVQVYDASISSNFPYIIMEYIEGKTLRHYIQEYTQSQKRIPLPTTLKIMYSIGLALAFAHENDITHRDVKPGNVLLENSGRVILTDFGLAQPVTDNEVAGKTFSGTPAYISPEQALGRSTGPRSDQYSLGTIFFEMVTGRLPFDSEDSLSVAISHVTHDIPSPKEYYPEIQDEIADIVVRATRRNKLDRYPSMDAFLKDITKIRIRSTTQKLPTASLKDLKESSDRVASWAAPSHRLGSEESLVCLHIVDTGQVIDLDLNREYLIGRKHKSQPILPDIDLSPFNAYEWGISRLHASISVQMNRVLVSDIGSANGTWYAGEQLEPNTPYELKHGDVLHLGKLKVQVLIYMDNDS